MYTHKARSTSYLHSEAEIERANVEIQLRIAQLAGALLNVYMMAISGADPEKFLRGVQSQNVVK